MEHEAWAHFRRLMPHAGAPMPGTRHTKLGPRPPSLGPLSALFRAVLPESNIGRCDVRHVLHVNFDRDFHSRVHPRLHFRRLGRILRDMRPRMRFPLLVSLCLLILPTLAAADEISSFSPPSFLQFSTEVFVTINGTGFQGTTTSGPPTEVVFSNGAGTFTLEPSSLTDTEIVVAVPDTSMSIPGPIAVTVLAHDTSSTRVIGPADLTVTPLVTNEPPLLNLPEAVIAEATSPSGANVTFTATALSFSPPVTVNCDHASGALYPIGTTIVGCTATDGFGSSFGTFPIFVTDPVAPVLTLPADIVTTNPVVSFTVTATDAVD